MRLGLIGTGPWGRILLHALNAIQTARVTRIATRRPESLDAVPQGCEVHADWRALIGAGDLDGVVIASPPAMHREMAEAALHLGLAVFLEKPMTLTATDAGALLARVRESGGILQIDHIDLFNPAWQGLRAHVGELGPLRSAEARFGADGPVRSDISALWDWAPHPVALALNLFGTSKSVRLVAIKRREPNRLNAAFELTFGNGVRVGIEAGNDFAQKERRFIVHGEHGSLCYDDRSPTKLVRRGPQGDAPLAIGDGTPVTRALQRFIDSIQAGQPSFEDAELGLGVVSAIAAIDEAVNAN